MGSSSTVVCTVVVDDSIGLAVTFLVTEIQANGKGALCSVLSIVSKLYPQRGNTPFIYYWKES